jgi:Polysaccharide lyase
MFKPVNAINYCYFFISVFLIAANTSFAQTTVRQNLLFESTFEGAVYLGGWYNSDHCCTYSVQQTTERVKAGSNALRIEVRNTDAPTNGTIRSEVALNSDPLDQEKWYGFSMYLKDWVDDNAGENVFNWQPDNDAGAPSMSLRTTGGRFSYVTNNTGTLVNTDSTDIGPVISNRWIDFVIRIRWATDNTGLLQVWMNGNQVINKSAVKTVAGTSYFKIGINKYGWGTQPSSVIDRILYFDEVREGNASATYNDVAPFLPRRDYFQGL